VSSLEDRAYVVTGAASGIGAAITGLLRGSGARILAVDLEASDDDPDAAGADLTVAGENARVVEEARERFGRLDGIVANAGVQHVAPVAEFPIEEWNRIVALMLTSPFVLARAAWPSLVESPAGRFVAIASVHGVVASPFKSAYVSAKHGVVGLVKTLALEGAEEGITATAVCPGYVRTGLVEGQVAAQAEATGVDESRVLDEVILEPHAVKRLIEPEEVAEVVRFLLSDAGAPFTGAPVIMDQGWTAR
jgi:3-hydroxybutyrate dehydrogenase